MKSYNLDIFKTILKFGTLISFKRGNWINIVTQEIYIIKSNKNFKYLIIPKLFKLLSFELFAGEHFLKVYELNANITIL